MKQHILKSFDTELSVLKKSLLEMLTITAEQVKLIYDAIAKHDVELAKCIIANDIKLDNLHSKIVTDSINLFSLRTPVAYDLRFVFSASHISSNLERTGDNLRNIAKNIIKLKNPQAEINFKLLQMVKIISDMLAETYSTLDKEDATKISLTIAKDLEIDKLNDDVDNLLLTVQKLSFSELDSVRNYLLIARSLERAGDHIVNSCKHIHFITVGYLLV